MADDSKREPNKQPQNGDYTLQHRLLELLDRAGLIIIALDDVGRLTFVNRGGAEILGWDPDELIGKNWFETVLPEPVRQMVRQAYLDAVEGEDFSPVFENDVLHKDGTPIDVLWHNIMLRDGDSRLVTTLSIGQDVQEITALREKSKRLLGIVDSAKDLIGWTGPDGVIEYINRGGAELLGYNSPDEVVGRHMNEFRSPEAAEMLSNVAIPHAIEHGEWRGEIPLRRPDGTEFPMSWAVVPQVKDGEVQMFSVIGRDTTAEKLSRQRIDALNKELVAVNIELEKALLTQQSFLANVSHELRTPLNSIIGFTGIMREGMAGPVSEEQKRQLDMVYASSTRLLRLINQVLDLSRLEAESVSVVPVEFDLAELLRRVAESSGQLADDKGLHLELDLVSKEMPATQDDLKVEQIVLNLVSNAIQHSEVGSITVTARLEESEYAVSVTDTGVGIADDELSRVFEQFYQSPSASKRKSVGTGLGLSIAKELTTLIGGSLEVESTLGSGSTFTLRFPTQIGATEDD